jgi:hypothetical protein
MSEAIPVAPTFLGQARAVITDSLRYWERKRIVYNIVLALVVIGYFVAAWPGSKTTITLNGGFVLFILTVLANVAFCAAYLADLFIQFSGFGALWHRWRWALFVLGTTFAAAITRFFSIGFFSSS